MCVQLFSGGGAKDNEMNAFVRDQERQASNSKWTIAQGELLLFANVP